MVYKAKSAHNEENGIWIRENICCAALGIIPWFLLKPPSIVYVFPEPAYSENNHV